MIWTFLWKAASIFQCEDSEQYVKQPETVTMEVYKPDSVVEIMLAIRNGFFQKQKAQSKKEKSDQKAN